MLQHEAELKSEEGFIAEFLTVEDDRCAISAMHYQRRSQDLIHGLSQMFRLAQQPYGQLKQKVLDSLSEEDRSRFHRAQDEFGLELRPSKNGQTKGSLKLQEA